MKSIIACALVSTLFGAHVTHAASPASPLFVSEMKFSLNPQSLDAAQLDAGKIDIASFSSDEVKALLTQMKPQIDAAIAVLNKAYEKRSAQYRLEARGYTLANALKWTSLRMIVGNTGMGLEMHLPADFNAGSQPTKESIISGYGDDYEETGTLTIMPTEIKAGPYSAR